MQTGSKLEDIQRFVKYADPGGADPNRPVVPGLVASHTPADIAKIKHQLMREYSPSANAGYSISLKPLEVSEDLWVGKMEFGDKWKPEIKVPLERMNLIYEQLTNSLVADDEIEVVAGSLYIVSYKVHRVVGRDPGKFGLRDMLTWEIREPGPDQGYHFTTAYVWC